MKVKCAVCAVATDIDDAATAYRCSNCGSFNKLGRDGTTRQPIAPAWGVAVLILSP
jgi:predicted RNA-binding Zn-ribbon protein involved in translation (DUF1610 family)